MDGAELRRKIFKTLLEEVEDIDYPSTTMLNRVEQAMRTPDDLSDYAEILVKKVKDTRHPSPAILNRLDTIATRLPATSSRG